jgi:hypothetical protein
MPLLGFVGQLISLDAEMSSVFPLTAPRIVEGWTPWVDRGDPMIGEDRDEGEIICLIPVRTKPTCSPSSRAAVTPVSGRS